MDTNAKTQQTNIFAKGMNTDVSDALIGNDQYRMANNMRYVTDDEENSGEMHVIEGAEKVLGNIPGTVRGMVSIREYGVIITEDENRDWYVYTWRPEIASLTLVVHIADHPLAEHNKLSLVSKYEDEQNIKVYIADGENPVCVVNIMCQELIEDYNKIVSYPNVVLAPPEFDGLIDGTLKEGVVQYSYQYYNEWGTATDASIPTRLIPLHNKDVALTSTANFKGVEQGNVSNKGVRIKIEDNLSFDYIRIFRITYVEAGQPPLIELILDTRKTNLQDGYYILEDTGYEALQIYSLEEYNGIAGIHIIPRVIESKDDYMFAACIKTAQTELDELLQSRGIVERLKAPQVEDEGIDIYNMSTPLYKVINSYGQLNGIVSWKFITHDLIGDENGIKTELIKLSKDGYANPKNVYDFASLRRDELYRFGVILYDDKGNHSSVFWIADVRTPSIYTTEEDELNPGVYKQRYQTFGIDSENKLKVFSLGIQFTVDVQTLAGEGITGYEIVRCNRTEKDVATIAQGVISRPGRRYDIYDGEKSQSFPLTPTGWLTTANVWSMPTITVFDAKEDDDKYIYSNVSSSRIFYEDVLDKFKTNTNIFQFVCPEYCYLDESFKHLTQNDNFYLSVLKYIYSNKFEDISFDLQHLIKLPVCYNGETSNFNINDYTASPPNMMLRMIATGNEYSKMPFSERDGSIYMPSEIHTYVYYNKVDEYNPENKKHLIEDEYFYEGRHQYLKLYNSANMVCEFNTYQQPIGTMSLVLNNVEVTDISTAKALNWDDFADQNNSAKEGEFYQIKYVNNLENVGDDSFVNWVSYHFYNMSITQVGEDENYLKQGDMADGWMDNKYAEIFGPGGKTALLKLNTIGDAEEDTSPLKYLYKQVFAAPDYNYASLFGTFICNLRKNVYPYGGNSDEAKRLSTYYSYGYYKSTTDTEPIDVYAGDCFVQPFEYVSMHKTYHPQVPNLRNSCIVYSIPVETNINLAYSYGYEFSKRFSKQGYATNVQDQPNDVNGFFIQDEPLYAYNGAYSSANKLKLFAAHDDSKTSISNEDYRCYYSNPKSNNESIDNWTIYQPLNFLDVDTRKGPITGLRTFHNSLVFWQRDATGLFSVNERTAITDESNMPLLLGTGGVLSRFDYINTSNGMRQNEFADTQSDSTLYWWDHDKADICAYAGGQESVILSKIKSVANFLNKHQKEDTLAAEPALTFDKKYNEMIASVTNGENTERGSLVYSELTQQFVGLYGINHLYDLLFADRLYLLRDSEHGLYRWNKSDDYKSKGIVDDDLLPYLKYITNDNQQMNKVFDNVLFGARVYGGGSQESFDDDRNHTPLEHLTFTFSTPLKQRSLLNGKDIENVEYDFRFAVPRADNAEYGNRMRGKTMQCELKSDSNSLDLSIQYITTKYRISWS